MSHACTPWAGDAPSLWRLPGRPRARYGQGLSAPSTSWVLLALALLFVIFVNLHRRVFLHRF